jgi:branched-chain amino acid transport system ATP-binding protein
MMEAILNIQNLYKHYDGIVAVDYVSLSIMPGTITGIFGDNGAGKTTLFNLLSGFEKPDNGSVFFEGKDITKKSVIYRSRHGVGRLFQIPRFFGDITVLDNLLAAGNNHEAKYLHNYLLKNATIKSNNLKSAAKKLGF